MFFCFDHVYDLEKEEFLKLPPPPFFSTSHQGRFGLSLSCAYFWSYVHHTIITFHIIYICAVKTQASSPRTWVRGFGGIDSNNIRCLGTF